MGLLFLIIAGIPLILFKWSKLAATKDIKYKNAHAPFVCESPGEKKLSTRVLQLQFVFTRAFPTNYFILNFI